MPSKFLPDLLTLDAHDRAELAKALWASVTDAGSIEAVTRRLVADLTESSPESIDLSRSLGALGVDSLRLIVLRERLQAEGGVTFSDDEWMALETPAAIIARAAMQPIRAASRLQSSSSQSQPSSPAAASAAPEAAGISFEELEIGMPLTGRNNLAETPLLQYLGDQRWKQVSRILDVPSRDIVDENGERLYATFFYVEVAFPADRPMDAFGENDRFTVVSTLTRFGASMLDGVSFLIPSDRSGPSGTSWTSAPYASVAEANADGVPAVRLSNIFVRKFGGAEWLKKGRPAHERFDAVPALAEPPDSYAMVKEAEEAGRFGPPPAGWLALTDGPVEREYRLVPDRDLNGVGLVYFANYPMFLDICERDVLSSARVPIAESLIDRRALVRRQSAYLNNASSRDTLRIEIEPWCHVTDAAGRGTERVVDLQLHVNARMSRRSDGRLMMVATSRKIVRDVPAADVPAAVNDLP